MGGIRGVVCSLGRAGVRRRGRCLALTAGFQSLLSAFTVNISLLFSSCCCFVICSSLANPALSGGCIEIWMTYLSEDNFCFNSGRDRSGDPVYSGVSHYPTVFASGQVVGVTIQYGNFIIL
ncbi:hypothetical protein Pcinc_032736 [Petrolisthes cinctipes]|uniref:Uncharacterized protein n=1 Tax=Petrolisthes cinctipes TaxID=88211 RepID=A0AAE1K0T5_PETCI|nr:hypothetical protein Pcinc_032736 [Petrolisthes cinctipes]